MKKTIVISMLLVLALIVSAFAGLYQSDLAHITMSVKAPTVNVVTVHVSLGDLDALQPFDSGVYSPPGKELIINNITLSPVVIYATNITAIEKAALRSCYIEVTVFNETTRYNGIIDVLNETVIGIHNLTGVYDVSTRVYGYTGIPVTNQLVDFNLTIDMAPACITGAIPLSLQFRDNSTSYDGIIAYAWDLNNDSIIDNTSQNVNCSYRVSGIYDVALTVYELDGDTSTDIRKNAVIAFIPMERTE